MSFQTRAYAVGCRVVLFLLTGGGPAGVMVPVQAADRVTEVLDSTARAELFRAVQQMEAQYDPEEQMIRRPFSSPGYHTTLKGGSVHPTRDSLRYAVALLDTGDEQLRKRSEDILRKVISLQDQDPASKTYGIWSWFLEEPLDRMSPPDWNWADFCGVQLLQVALHHRSRLPADLARKVDEAIRHAARSIQRRNVGPGYTNIAIMGTYVTLVAAELYAIEDLRSYALQRLQRFHDYTREQGAFTEYNSPTYTVVALEEIGRLRLHVKDPEARRLANAIYRVAWEEIAHHFHVPTRQWSGPHSRCYNTLLPDKTLGMIQHATGGAVRFFPSEPPRALEEFRLPLPCPEDLQHYFSRLDTLRELVKTFVKSDNPVIGTTCLAPEFTLGTVNRGDLWNQRRPLLAYWGVDGKPAYLRLRFLHDDYDFAAAQFRSVQRQGMVLGAVVLATDGGDTHVSLDRIKNATVKARDFRLRFEFGGSAGDQKGPVAPGNPGAPVRYRSGPVTADIQVPFARFGTNAGRWEGSGDKAKGISWLDVILYSGSSREFKLDDLESAAVAFCLRLGTGVAEPMPRVECVVKNGRAKLTTRTPALELEVAVKPAKAAELQKPPRR